MSQTTPMEQAAGNRLVFEESAEIPTPVAEVFRRWTDFTRFPEFMSNVQEVRTLGADRYHWVARVFGTKQEWDAEVTDREPDRRVAWRSINGPYNAGTVSLSPLPNGKTEVRMRLEYTPPAGQIGQRLDRMTLMARREIKENLENFKRVITGGPSAMGEPQTPADFGGVLASLAAPAIAAVVVGTGAWFLDEDLVRARRGVKAPRGINKVAHPVMPEADIASWVWTGLSLGGVLAAAILRSQGRRNDGLFVGQWAPTLIQLGVLSRFIGRRELPHPVANAASYALAGAGLASIIPSAITHASGRRGDGLFIGQWAPTFMGLSLLMRLLNR
jgi:uncharacterized membrane protein